jgi:hypothetical protein
VDPRRHFVVNRDAWHAQLGEKLCGGSYVLLHAHRQGGKTSAIAGVRRVLRQKQQDYFVLSVSLQGANLSSRGAVWRSLASTMSAKLERYQGSAMASQLPAVAGCASGLPFTDAGSFMTFFKHRQWGGRRVALVLDEFDTLLGAADEVRDDVLSTLRAMKTSNAEEGNDERFPYALHALLGIGVYRIVKLGDSSTRVVSPFNVASAISPPDPTPEDVRAMFRAYDAEYGVSTDPAVVDDIIWRAGGHVGLLSLMGKQLGTVYEEMVQEMAQQAARAAQPRTGASTADCPHVSITRWRRTLCRRKVVELWQANPTVSTLVSSVALPHVEASVSLRVHEFLELMFYLPDGVDFLRRGADQDGTAALEYLQSEGVVVPMGDGYRFTAPLLRLLLYPTFGSKLDWTVARGTPAHRHSDGTLDMVAMMTELLEHFSATQLLHVLKLKKSGSPREFAYHFQLHGLLSQRLRDLEWEVLSEAACVDAEGKVRRLDIYVKDAHGAYGFELVADGADLAKHIYEQAPTYLERQELKRVLVVNFTTEPTDVGTAPSDLPAGVELMHVLVDVRAKTMTPYTLHSATFTAGSTVKMRDTDAAAAAARARATATMGVGDLTAQLQAASIATPPSSPARGGAAAAPAGAVGRVRLCLNVGGGNLIEWRSAGDVTVDSAVARCAKRLPVAPVDGPGAVLVRCVGEVFRVQDADTTLAELVGERDLFIRHCGQDFPLSVE